MVIDYKKLVDTLDQNIIEDDVTAREALSIVFSKDKNDTSIASEHINKHISFMAREIGIEIDFDDKGYVVAIELV